MPGTRRFPRHVVVALMLVATAACSDGRSPVAPSSFVPLTDLSGAWTGSMVVEWDPIDGGGSCRQDSLAAVNQTAERVTITVSAAAGSCLAAPTEFLLVGEMRGPLLFLNMQPSQLSPAWASFSAERLEIRWYNTIWALRR